MLRKRHHHPRPNSSSRFISNKSGNPSFLSNHFNFNQKLFNKTFSSTVDNNWINDLRKEFEDKKETIDEKYELELIPEKDSVPQQFQFQDNFWSSIRIKEREKENLSLGRDREFIPFAQAYSFPEFRDHPSRFEPSVPSTLWTDPSSSTPKLLYQLSPSMPPLLWLPFKPSLNVVQRCIDDIIEVESDAIAKDAYEYEELDQFVKKELGTSMHEGDPQLVHETVLEAIADRDPSDIRTTPHENTAHLFLGNVTDFSSLETSFMINPFVFNLPLFYGSRNNKLRLSSSSLIFSSFRTIFSRSIITLEARYDLQYRSAKTNSNDQEDTVPIFARVNYPSLPRLSGPVPQRYNKLFNTEYPDGMPVDVIAAFSGNRMVGYSDTEEELKHIEQTQGEDYVSPLIIVHLASLNYQDTIKIMISMFVLLVLKEQRNYVWSIYWINYWKKKNIKMFDQWQNMRKSI
eukprot:gb/GECH01007083.1/.p1 GENE.gb/GECH01007083.1/~~gb/GECH01007083.1/.p1  ORF type:complete len:459 (+),score=89.96 gb/GECH01007083.1/:1-1377(+)